MYDVQCHITQRHERRAPYTSRRLAELLSNNPCLMGSDFLDARTGSSPNSSVRTRELIVALQLNKSAQYENASNASRAARVCGCVKCTGFFMKVRSTTSTTARSPDWEKSSIVRSTHDILDQMTYGCRRGLANRKPPVIEGLHSGR